MMPQTPPKASDKTAPRKVSDEELATIMKKLDRKEFQPGMFPELGYISPSHVLFPIGYKFKGGFISWRDVVLQQCPECGLVMKMSSEQVKGICEDVVSCGYSAIEALDNTEID